MHRVGRIAMLGAAILLLTSVQFSVPAAVPGAVHFTAAGDYSMNPSTNSVLNAISAADPDLNLALGDLSYGVTGEEQTFCDIVTSRVGAGFPFELISGNHESNGQNGNINDFASCLPNQLPGVVGTYGRQYYVDVPKDNPIVRYVMISPSLPFPDGTWNYPVGSARYNWTAAAIDGARSANIPWVVVGMHKPCVSVGEYACEPGADITNLLLSKKVDLVLTGHEHLYARTKQLGLGTGCTSLTIGSYNAGCVKDSDSSLVAGAGTVFATVGTGGVALRDVNLADPEAPYFVTTSGSNANPTYGFLDVTADADSLDATFTRGAGGTFTDSFSITKGSPEPNNPPNAAFSSTPIGLTVGFDGGGSTDSDGVVASYAWSFGDASTGTGINPSHPYAAAGTYNVTLTVTDDDGATGSVTQPVTVTAPPGPTTIASDNFERTVASGWGTAPMGGAWGTTGGVANFAVGSGTGRLTMASAGVGPSAFLNAVASTDTDVRVSVTLDKVPAGGTTGGVESLLARRVNGQGNYIAAVGIRPGGVVRLNLVRTNSAGAETNLAGPVTISGLTYTAGMSLTIRAQATGTSPTTVRAKVWVTGQPEPAAWTASITDGQSELQAAGGVGVKSYVSSSATNAPIISRFDNLVAYLASTVP